MGYKIYIFTITMLISTRLISDDRTIAKEKTIEAILLYPEVKSLIKTNKNRFIKKIEVEETTVTNVAIVLASLYSKKIETAKFENIRYKLECGYLRPDIYYNMKTSDYGGILSYKWSFK